jgi:hypothetical protein
VSCQYRRPPPAVRQGSPRSGGRDGTRNSLSRRPRPLYLLALAPRQNHPTESTRESLAILPPKSNRKPRPCNKSLRLAEIWRDWPQPAKAGSDTTKKAGDGHLSGFGWCGREDSNFHGLPHSDLNAARLPIPPRPRRRAGCSKSTAGLQGKWTPPDAIGQKPSGARSWPCRGPAGGSPAGSCRRG